MERKGDCGESEGREVSQDERERQMRGRGGWL